MIRPYVACPCHRKLTTDLIQGEDDLMTGVCAISGQLFVVNEYNLLGVVLKDVSQTDQPEDGNRPGAASVEPNEPIEGLRDAGECL